MKKAIILNLLAAACFLSRPATALPALPPGELRHPVSFEPGDAEFAPGDSITIQAVRGTQPALAVGQTYCVIGSYTLHSKDEAELSFFVTTTNTVASPIDPAQTVHVRKGSGTFSLVKTLDQAGYPHLSFYPAGGGNAFGGIYFGQGQWVLRHKGFSYLESSGATAGSPPSAEAKPGALPEQNRRLLDYLGKPVAPPSRLDPAYTKAGLIAASRRAAERASIDIKRIEIEDSEFPFLVGIVCAQGGYPKWADQVKKMSDYEDQGGVSTRTCFAVNITPYRTFPSDAAERIGRRLTLREEMFFHQLTRGGRD